MALYTEPTTGIPTGTVTLLFTDIAGSSRLWETHGDAFISVWQTHDALMNNTIRRFGGFVVKTEGDAFMVAFSDAKAALYTAIYAQVALRRYPWPHDVETPRVRMGLHTGEPFIQNNDYFGPTVNRAAYICAKAIGEQIILSSETMEAIGSRADAKIAFDFLGEMPLKGETMPQRLFQAHHPGMKQEIDTASSSQSTLRTCMVGQARGLEQFASVLAMGEKPVLSVVGRHGMGRVRVRTEGSDFKADWFPDGVWYARLKGAKNVHEAAMEIAFALGFPFASSESVLTELRGWLAEQRVLLILDDACEVSIVDRLVREMLSGAETLKCIATSSRSMSVKEKPLTTEEVSLPEPEPIYVRPRGLMPEVDLPPVAAAKIPNPTEAMNLRVSEASRLQAERLLNALNEPYIQPLPANNPVQQLMEPLRPLVNSTIGSERFRSLMKEKTQRALVTGEEVARTLLSGIGQIVQGNNEAPTERSDPKRA
jgi:class 3 adenylate cyclase